MLALFLKFCVSKTHLEFTEISALISDSKDIFLVPFLEILKDSV